MAYVGESFAVEVERLALQVAQVLPFSCTLWTSRAPPLELQFQGLATDYIEVIFSLFSAAARASL